MHLHPLLDDELPHLAGPLVTEPAEVEADQGVVDPLQEEDDETSLLSEGILCYVGEFATELSLVRDNKCLFFISFDSEASPCNE